MKFQKFISYVTVTLYLRVALPVIEVKGTLGAVRLEVGDGLADAHVVVCRESVNSCESECGERCTHLSYICVLSGLSQLSHS